MDCDRCVIVVLAVLLATLLTFTLLGPRGETREQRPPEVGESAVSNLAAGTNAFAFDLYQAVRDSGENVLFSPVSVSAALAMTYAGARGKTEYQMANVLHFGMPQDSLHPEFRRLLAELESKEDTGLELHIANSLWVQLGYALLPGFLNTVATNYGAEPRYLEFLENPEQSRNTINEWVRKETREKIKDLLPPGSIDPLTRLVLVNAVYFKTAWVNRFPAYRTGDDAFYLLDGEEVKVPMMRQEAWFRYAASEGWEVIELPYVGGSAAMVVLVPPRGQFKGYEKRLDLRVFTRLLGLMSATKVRLTMPKFKFDWGGSLEETLAQMGMGDALDSKAADFSGMNGERCNEAPRQCLYIGDVLHKAFIGVDENGTEAAAATAVVMPMGAGPPGPEQVVEMRIDRPFIFAIRDNRTGTILFLGRVLAPRC